jgi:mono/diheme cytochrome c family protein
MWRAMLISSLFVSAGLSMAAVDDQKSPAPAQNMESPARPAAPPASLPRGTLLYENHCQGCHESRLHVREQRRATTRAALRGWVTHWAMQLKLSWGEAEIDDVVDHLNRRYYKLPSE